MTLEGQSTIEGAADAEDARDTLRAWLGLLNASNSIKKTIDGQLRNQFGMSISRFDVLAVLDRRAPRGLRAGELSRQLMVTQGNTTQVTAPLVRDGYVARRPSADDARGVVFTLTPKGRAAFAAMAAAHQTWIQNAFARLGHKDLLTLRHLLDQLHLQPNENKE